MNRHREKLLAVTVCKTSAACDHALDPDLPETPTVEPFLVNSLLFDEIEGMLNSLARILKQRDHHTAGHSERLAFASVALGTAMRLDSTSLLSLYVGGYLHDIGKVSIPDSVLFKPDKLTGEEWEIMRDHPVRGEEICRSLTSFHCVLPLIRNHHERWDGSGYPDGLRGAQIPLLARVIQVVDIYDALTNPRPYKRAYSSAHALETLQEETARGWRDKEITSLFIRVHRQMMATTGKPPIVDLGLGTIGDSLRNLQIQLAQ